LIVKHAVRLLVGGISRRDDQADLLQKRLRISRPPGVILRPEPVRARLAQVTAGPKDLTADTRDLLRKPRECRG